MVETAFFVGVIIGLVGGLVIGVAGMVLIAAVRSGNPYYRELDY